MCALHACSSSFQKEVKGCQEGTSGLQLVKKHEKSLEKMKKKFRKRAKNKQMYSKEVRRSPGKINSSVKRQEGMNLTVEQSR